MPKSIWPAFVLIACALFSGAGCTKQARMERHLSRGDKHFAAGDYEAAEIEYRVALQLVPNDPVAMGRVGTLYYNDGRIVPAYALLQLALKERPDDLALQTTFGLASLTLAKTADARIAAKKVLAGQPTNEDAVLLLVATCITARDIEESRRLIEQLLEHNKDMAAYHVALGDLAMKQRDRAVAEQEFRKALELDPKSSAAYAELGGLFLLYQDLKQAGPALKTAAELAPPRSPRKLKYIDFLIRTDAADDAKQELAKITTSLPTYVPAWTMTMQLASKQRDYTASLAAAEKILTRDPINFDALMERVKVDMSKGDVDGAIVQLNHLVNIYDHAPEVRYQLAQAYLKNDDQAHAEEQLTQAIRLSPTYADAIVALADLNLQKGNGGAAIAPLTQLLKRQPKLGQATLLLARAYRSQGDLNGAAATLRQSTEALPQSPEPPYLMGTVLLGLNRRDEAVKAFEESVRQAEDYWPANEMLVDADLAEKRTAAAAERTEHLIEKYPKATPPRLFRAKVRLLSGDVDGAEADLLKAIELDPKSGYAYFQLAKVYLQSDHAEKAIAQLTGFAAQTNNVTAYMQLGMIQDALRRYPEARAAYEKLLAVSPKFIPALNNLAVLCSEKLGQLEQGFDYAKRARGISPTDSSVADTLGWIYFRKGQFDSALPLLQQASSIRPGDPDIAYHLGMVHNFLGHEGPAKAAFARVVAAGENSPMVDDARRRLAVLSIDVDQADATVRADLEKRAHEDASDPMLLTRLAAIERRDGTVDRAAAHYEAALKLSPRSATIMTALVELYLGPVPQPDRARELAKSAHELAPTDAQISWYLGHLLYGAGEYAWAAALLEEASGQLRNPSAALYDLLFAYYHLGRLRDTEGTLRRFLAGDPPTPAARQAAERLEAMLDAGASPEKAQAALPQAREILAAEPDYVPALMVSALAREQAGDFAGAQKIYDGILAKNPAFALATRQLAILYAEHLGDDQKAEDLALVARKTFPDDCPLAYEVGVVEYRKGDYTNAARFLQQSTREPTAEAMFFLGMSQYQLKKLTESRNALQKALELNLAEQEAAEARRVLDEMSRSDHG